jgi:hypothetical protein
MADEWRMADGGWRVVDVDVDGDGDGVRLPCTMSMLYGPG